jgi:GYF domain 2
MQIYINKNNQQLGPFDEEKVKEMLAKGEISLNDLGIRQGDVNWQELGAMFPNTNTTNSKISAVNVVLTIFGLLIIAPSLIGTVINGLALINLDRVHNSTSVFFAIAVVFLLLGCLLLFIGGRKKLKILFLIFGIPLFLIGLGSIGLTRGYSPRVYIESNQKVISEIAKLSNLPNSANDPAIKKQITGWEKLALENDREIMKIKEMKSNWLMTGILLTSLGFVLILVSFFIKRKVNPKEIK